MALVTKSFSDIITFTRTGTTATYFNSAGVLVNAGANVPRFDYDPITLAAKGLLIEEARTNSIRNNTMQGAVAGTPGTFPQVSGSPTWSIAGGGLGTLTQQIVGVSTSNGITYIDIKFSGTTSTTNFNVSFETATQIGAVSGQTWTESAYAAIVGGSTTNITNIRLQLEGRNSGGTTVESFLSAGIQGSLTSALQRYTLTSTFADATTAFARPTLRFDFSSGVAIDITLRIGLPQLEQGAFATSVIPTTTTALTRNADQASVNTLSPWFNSTAGTLYVEAQIAAGIGAAPAVMAGLDDTTINNRMQLRRQFPGNTGDYRFVSSGGNFTGSALSGALTSVNKQAGAYAASDQAGAVNSTLMTGIVSVATLPTITRLALGDGQGSTPLNGWLRRVVFYPRRLSNAELQAITA